MTDDDDQAVSAEARPASCKADLISSQFATCERCALAWDPLCLPHPACSPVTPRRLQGVLERAISRAEASHETTLAIFNDDPRAANPIPSLVLMLELKAVERLLERVLTNKQILALLRT